MALKTHFLTASSRMPLPRPASDSGPASNPSDLGSGRSAYQSETGWAKPPSQTQSSHSSILTNMADYDYSPEAYERYVLAQGRIARWVDTTEAHRPEFGNPFVDPSLIPTSPGHRPTHSMHDVPPTLISPPGAPASYAPQNFNPVYMTGEQQQGNLYMYPTRLPYLPGMYSADAGQPVHPSQQQGIIAAQQSVIDPKPMFYQRIFGQGKGKGKNSSRRSG